MMSTTEQIIKKRAKASKERKSLREQAIDFERTPSTKQDKTCRSLFFSLHKIRSIYLRSLSFYLSL